MPDAIPVTVPVAETAPVTTESTTPVATATPVPETIVAPEPTVADPAPAAEALKAPEKYEFVAPEGQPLNSDVLGAFENVARELDLSQDAAQNVISKVAPVMLKAQQAEMTRAKNEWIESSKSDAEFGGDKLPENLAIAEKAFSTFGTPELKQLLHQTGLNNHPEIIRAFYRAGKQISSSAFVPGGLAHANDTAPLANQLYPHLN